MNRLPSCLAKLFLRTLQSVVWLLLIIGLALQFTIRDSVDDLAFAFYMLPMPLLLCLALLLSFWLRLCKRCYHLALVIAVIAGLTWTTRSWCWHAEPAQSQRLPHEVRVMFWNLGRPGQPNPDFIKLVNEFQPDIIGCTEPVARDRKPDVELWQKALPQYQVRPAHQELLWMTRSAPQNERTGWLHRIGSYARLDVPLDNKLVPVAIADVWAAPMTPRTEQIREALALIAGHSDALLLGDFNTPGESVHFDAFRRDMDDAFESGGRGLRETWFYSLPVLSLDHIWIGKDWQVLDARKVWSASSDHAAVLVRLLPSSPPTTNQSTAPGTGE